MALIRLKAIDGPVNIQLSKTLKLPISRHAVIEINTATCEMKFINWFTGEYMDYTGTGPVMLDKDKAKTIITSNKFRKL